jgi:hypothetical protein
MQGFWKKSPIAVLVVAGALGVVGVVFATSGIASTGNSSATGRSAQEPLGTLSGTAPGTEQGSGIQGKVEQGGPGTGGQNDSVEGLQETSGTGSGGGGGGSSLPFTGFVAIPLLVAGTVLLLTGVGLRRKAARTAAS